MVLSCLATFRIRVLGFTDAGTVYSNNGVAECPMTVRRQSGERAFHGIMRVENRGGIWFWRDEAVRLCKGLHSLVTVGSAL